MTILSNTQYFYMKMTFLDTFYGKMYPIVQIYQPPRQIRGGCEALLFMIAFYFIFPFTIFVPKIYKKSLVRSIINTVFFLVCVALIPVIFVHLNDAKLFIVDLMAMFTISAGIFSYIFEKSATRLVIIIMQFVYLFLEIGLGIYLILESPIQSRYAIVLTLLFISLFAIIMNVEHSVRNWNKTDESMDLL